MGMIKSPAEFKLEKAAFDKALGSAVSDRKYESFAYRTKVDIPSDVRLAYANLFKDRIQGFPVPFRLGNRSVFSGVDERSCLYDLQFSPTYVKLEVSSYSFNGCSNPGIREIGLITTRHSGGKLITTLEAGETFKYNSGFRANHSISAVIDVIQESEVIPHISEKSIRGYSHSRR